MDFQIVDTGPIYRRLMDAPTPEAREAVFSAELVAPFEGLARFFGMDGLSAFRMWQMPPELFADRDRIAPMLDAMAAFDVWNKAEQALHKGWAAFAPYADRLQLSNDTITFALMISENPPFAKGYAGFGAIPPWIMTTIGEANAYTLPRIATATAHELHHNLAATVRGRTPMIASLADYLVGEGLAESFGASLYGEDTIGYYVTDFDEARWEDTVQIIGANLEETDFNTVRGFVFGNTGGFNGVNETRVPLYAGYALGYRAVQAYLAKTGSSVVEATFVPAREILAESGLFRHA